MHRPEFAITELDVIRWAEARKIIPRSTPVAQARKTLEEAGELLEAAAKLHAFDGMEKPHPHLRDDLFFVARKADALAEYRDAVGDVMVTLVVGAALADVDLRDCFAAAYEVIKDRKGTLLPNGIFQKEA